MQQHDSKNPTDANELNGKRGLGSSFINMFSKYSLRKKAGLITGVAAAALIVPAASQALSGNTSNSTKNAGATDTELTIQTPKSTAASNENKLDDDSSRSSASLSQDITAEDEQSETDMQTEVTVNGQDITVPQNGTVRETVTNSDGPDVKVEVRSSSSSSSSVNGSSSTRVKVQSNGTSYSSDDDSSRTGRESRHRR